MKTCEKCFRLFPFLVKVNGKRRNLCNRRVCLDCKPFRHGAAESMERRGGHEACVVCAKPWHQRLCRACRTKIRRQRAKQAAVDMLGGKCSRCGWSGNIVALQFHHVRGKDFAISSVAHKSWALIKAELKKCELLCANCHTVEHSDRASEAFLNEVARYKGDFYD